MQTTRVGRRVSWMSGLLFFTLLIEAAMAGSPPGHEPASCRVVRMADVGWTDVTATTALMARVLTQMGYEPKITVLSLPVTYASLANKDIDVFMGNWMPAQDGDRRPYLENGSIEVVRTNLVGAKYTLATLAPLYEAGLHDFADIAKFGPQLQYTIYGIEAGNDGNRHVLDMIRRNQFGLGKFRLVESSEQGMLAQVQRAANEHQPIVFLAWDPHPMNRHFDLRYLTGGDAVFGPDFGGATIHTVVRRGYREECPNLGRLLANVSFTLPMEDEIMDGILNLHEQPDKAAADWMAANPAALKPWFQGVSTFDGHAVDIGHQRTGPGPALTFDQRVGQHKIPIGDWVTDGIEYVKAHGTWVFDGISLIIHGSVDGMTRALRAVPSWLLVLAISGLALLLRRSWMLAVFVAAALVFIMNQGYWDATVETLSLVLVAAFISTLLGVPIGILAAHHPRFHDVLRPVLDLMQTLPTFVYLIPTLVLFGLGVVPGLISTIIFALPAPIRLTQLGISSVPTPLLEAGQAFGATHLQMLWKVELPSAAPSIIAGITQCIMLSLSMVVIAALVGAGGLGVPVVRALNSVQIGMGFEAGFAIVLLAIVLDRITRPREERSRK